MLRWSIKSSTLLRKWEGVTGFEQLSFVECITMVSCQKGPTRHAYAWQIGPFWQDTLDLTGSEIPYLLSDRSKSCRCFSCDILAVKLSIRLWDNCKILRSVLLEKIPTCRVTRPLEERSSSWERNGMHNDVMIRTRWRHQMGTFSALLSLCAGNSPITSEFPSHCSRTGVTSFLH